MKTRKTKSIIQQIIIILSFNFAFLVGNSNFNINSGFGSELIFILAFFHTGAFTSLYVTFESKELTKEKNVVLFKFIYFILFFSLFLVFYFKCQPKTPNVISCYILGMLTLIQSVVVAIETFKSYMKYQINKK